MNEEQTLVLIEQYRREAETEKAKSNFEFAFILFDTANRLEERIVRTAVA